MSRISDGPPARGPAPRTPDSRSSASADSADPALGPVSGSRPGRGGHRTLLIAPRARATSWARFSPSRQKRRIGFGVPASRPVAPGSAAAITGLAPAPPAALELLGRRRGFRPDRARRRRFGPDDRDGFRFGDRLGSGLDSGRRPRPSTASMTGASATCCGDEPRSRRRRFLRPRPAVGGASWALRPAAAARPRRRPSVPSITGGGSGASSSSAASTRGAGAVSARGALPSLGGRPRSVRRDHGHVHGDRLVHRARRRSGRSARSAAWRFQAFAGGVRRARGPARSARRGISRSRPGRKCQTKAFSPNGYPRTRPREGVGRTIAVLATARDAPPRRPRDGGDGAFPRPRPRWAPSARSPPSASCLALFAGRFSARGPRLAVVAATAGAGGVAAATAAFVVASARDGPVVAARGRVVVLASSSSSTTIFFLFLVLLVLERLVVDRRGCGLKGGRGDRAGQDASPELRAVDVVVGPMQAVVDQDGDEQAVRLLQAQQIGALLVEDIEADRSADLQGDLAAALPGPRPRRRAGPPGRWTRPSGRGRCPGSVRRRGWCLPARRCGGAGG